MLIGYCKILFYTTNSFNDSFMTIMSWYSIKQYENVSIYSNKIVLVISL